MITFESKGSFDKTESWLRKLMDANFFTALDRYGEMGRKALASATPVETGLTASSWTFNVSVGNGGFEIVWSNTRDAGGKPLAIMLQYGHGTGTGGYVAGRDYINPAIQPVFDQIANALWEEVTRA